MAKEEKKRKFVFRVNGFVEDKEEIITDCVLFPLYKIESDKEDSKLKDSLLEKYKENRKMLLNKIGIAIRELVIEVDSLKEEKEKKKGLADLKFRLRPDEIQYSEETLLLEIKVTFVPTILPLFEEGFEQNAILLQVDLGPKKEDVKKVISQRTKSPKEIRDLIAKSLGFRISRAKHLGDIWVEPKSKEKYSIRYYNSGLTYFAITFEGVSDKGFKNIIATVKKLVRPFGIPTTTSKKLPSELYGKISIEFRQSKRKVLKTDPYRDQLEILISI